MRLLSHDNTSVTVSWAPPLPSVANGVITKYEVTTVPMTTENFVGADGDVINVSIAVK